MFLDGATVRSSLRSGVDASPSLCDERRLAMTSGGQRGTIGSASPRNRGNPPSPPRHACEGRHRTSAGTPAARLAHRARAFVCLWQPSHFSLAWPRARPERARTAKPARRAEGRMPGVKKSNQKRRPPRLVLAAHRATAPVLPQLGHPCPRHGPHSVRNRCAVARAGWISRSGRVSAMRPSLHAHAAERCIKRI
jgi:hypothetical protein